MRILTLSYEFPPIGGGGSGVVKGLADELARQGHEIDVVTMGFRDLPAQEATDGIVVHRVDCGRKSESKCTPLEAFRYARRAGPVIAGLVERRRYDLAHVHFIFPDGLLAAWRVAPKGIPYVITAHGSDVPGYNPKPFFKIAHPLLAPIWRRVTKGASEIVSPSETLADLIQAVGPGTAVSVIPNGIPTDRFRANTTKKDQVLVATRLVERKGVQYLLRALHGSSVGWPVLIAGSGEYEAELRRLNEELGRPATFIGWLDNGSPEFAKLLEESAIFVLPSDFENFPVSLLEAMASGAAIVTTSGHGCEEVVGDCAEFVPTGREDPDRCIRELRAALERLTADREHRSELGAKARKRLEENFSWKAVAARYLDLYRKHTRNGA